MLEFQGENFMRNNFHAALEAKIQTEMEEIKDQSKKFKQVSVQPNGHVHGCITR